MNTNQFQDALNALSDGEDMLFVVEEALEHYGNNPPDLPGNGYACTLMAVIGKLSEAREGFSALLEAMQQEAAP
ncbi:MAG: hypothetical protein IJ662_02650 [Clostridia bacterium]|nr:hypothetical protein [Clostridia bacterium]